VGVSERLLPFLPVPIVGKAEEEDRVPTRKDPTAAGQVEAFRWLTEQDLPQSIGRLSGFMGNAGILLRAYIYMRMLGRQGMPRVAEYATLNANYLMARLTQQGFDAAFPRRRATHEFILTLKRQAKTLGVNTMAFAKRLLDKGFHAPTTYFPLLVPECLLIEPTETESKQELDRFIDAMCEVLREAEASPELVNGAPHGLPVRRLDDVRAAKELDLTWRAEKSPGIAAG
jgi:glycine dehydrogenase subunit 2